MVALKLSQAKASGCPVVVIPAGTDRNGVPFGAQLIGPRWRDERLLAIAEAITAATSGFQPPPGADTENPRTGPPWPRSRPGIPYARHDMDRKDSLGLSCPMSGRQGQRNVRAAPGHVPTLAC